MSDDHAKAVRAVYESWSQGDFRAAVNLLDPQVIIVLGPQFGYAETKTYLGPESIAAYTRDLLETWPNFRMEAEEIVVAGDSVLVHVHQTGAGSTSGVPTELRYFTLWSFRAEKVIRIESFRERAEALDAAGLSE